MKQKLEILNTRKKNKDKNQISIHDLIKIFHIRVNKSLFQHAISNGRIQCKNN